MGLARPAEGDFAYAVGDLDCNCVLRFHVASDGDDKTIHHIFDAVGLLMDRLQNALVICYL